MVTMEISRNWASRELLQVLHKDLLSRGTPSSFPLIASSPSNLFSFLVSKSLLRSSHSSCASQPPLFWSSASPLPPPSLGEPLPLPLEETSDRLMLQRCPVRLKTHQPRVTQRPLASPAPDHSAMFSPNPDPIPPSGKGDAINSGQVAQAETGDIGNNEQSDHSARFAADAKVRTIALSELLNPALRLGRARKLTC